MFNRVKLMLAVALGRMLGSAPISLHRAAMDHNRTVEALRAAEARPETQRPTRLLGSRLAESAARLLPLRRAKGNGYRGPNGAQAMARRVRQIRNGHATAGLLYTGFKGQRMHFDSHGRAVDFYPA